VTAPSGGRGSLATSAEDSPTKDVVLRPNNVDEPNIRAMLVREENGSISRFIWRFRLAAVAACLTALAFIQDPGRIAADTKLDLAINPGGLLARSLHLWDPQSFAGSLQNQAYGYLWPMGPFFWLGDSVGIPAWVIQRLWWATLLTLAFLGVVRVIRLLDLGGPTVRILAGLSYALSPMLLSKLGPISSEVLPFALAPWLLIPLIVGSRTGSVRRAAALSGLAFFCIGGVNAVAALAVLPIGAIWILTRSAGPRKRALAGWWALAITLASLWWFIPLLLLGGYSPPFLDWIESASITTSVTDPLSVLRGAGDWVAYLAAETGPVWSLGYEFAYSTVLLLSSGLVAILGLMGLIRRDLPERGFVAITVLLGFGLVSLGHVSAAASPAQSLIRTALDGVLAPLRNVHKFDPVLRIGLALALAWLLTVAAQKLRDRTAERGWPKVKYRLPMVGVVFGLLAATFATAMTGVTAGRSYLEIPEYWRETSAYLAAENPTGRALVVPTASAAQFQWGRTQDEPLQALGDTAWDVRDSVPLGNAGHTRLLDEISARLEDGRGSPGLATVLERAGVQWVVVRNDIEPRMTDVQSIVRVHQSISASPGIDMVAGFGPLLGGSFRAVEVFQVGELDPSPVQANSVDGALRVTGGAEAQLSLADAGLLDDRLTVMAGSPGSDVVAATDIATNTLRKRETNFGFVRGNKSNTLTADDEWIQNRPVHDYLNPDTTPLTLAELDGAVAIETSSNASDASAYLARDQSAQPFAALDGDSQTAWRSAATGESAVGQWWSVRFAEEISAPYLDLDLPLSQADSRTIEVVTDQSRESVQLDNSAQVARIPLGDRPTKFIRIELTDTSGGFNDSQFVISGVSIPGVEVRRPLRTQTTGPVAGAVLSATSGGRSQCVDGGGQYRCAPEYGRVGEDQAGLDQWVWLQAGTYEVAASVRPRGSQAFEKLATTEADVVANGSSNEYEDFVASPQSAVDGLPQTGWYPAVDDERPRLEITLPKTEEVTAVQIESLPAFDLSKPLSVTIEAGGKQTTAFVDSGKAIPIPKVSTDSVVIWIDSIYPAYAARFDDSSLRPLGISDVTVETESGTREAVATSRDTPVDCGTGPTVSISNGGDVATGGAFTRKQAIEGSSFDLAGCGQKRSLAVDEGWHRITTKSTDALIVERVDVLPTAGLPATGAATATEVMSWEATSRSVDVAAAESSQVLETGESYNKGWAARLGDEPLSAIEVDGWRQGWVIPAGSSGIVNMEFTPDDSYRNGLLLGALAVAGLLALILVRGARDARPALGSRVRQWMLIAVLGGTSLLLWNPIVLALAILTSWVATRLFGRKSTGVVPWRYWLVATFGAVLVILQVAATVPISSRSPAWVEVVSAYLLAVVFWVVLASWPTAKRTSASGESGGAAADGLGRRE
jgi:arabinofuranan 3-O-arabinosyltransferase